MLKVALGYLAGLVLLGLVYARLPTFRTWLPNPLGPIPLDVIWWGALGAAMISLTGIARHYRSWDRDWELWHVVHPVLGAVSGSIGYLIFSVVIRGATGANITNPSPVAHAEFDLVAFIVGFRQQIFWNLIKRASDLLLSPGHSTDRDAQDV